MWCRLATIVDVHLGAINLTTGEGLVEQSVHVFHLFLNERLHKSVACFKERSGVLVRNCCQGSLELGMLEIQLVEHVRGGWCVIVVIGEDADGSKAGFQICIYVCHCCVS